MKSNFPATDSTTTVKSLEEESITDDTEDCEDEDKKVTVVNMRSFVAEIFGAAPAVGESISCCETGVRSRNEEASYRMAKVFFRGS